MSHSVYQNLCWLPAAPADFSTRCQLLARSEQELGKQIQALASYALDYNQLNRLAKVLKKFYTAGADVAPLVPFRLGVLSNSTTEFIVPSLVATAARYGIALDCVQANYNQVIQEALDPNSTVNCARPDAVLVAIDYRALPLHVAPGDRDRAQAAVRSAVEYLETISTAIKKNSKAVCIFQTFAAPAESAFGSLDRQLPGTLRQMIDAVNAELARNAFDTTDLLVDIAGLAEIVGLSNWHCPAQWNLAKLPFSSDFLPLYAEHVIRVIAAQRGKSRRCLVLDLDNTLWGGVIGDDGVSGIQIAQGDPAGEAHLSLQRMALSLRDRGIVLAVSSKNNDDVARLPFREHPEMLLREEHFAAFQANWQDKATNIKAIAEELSLGLESMVFLDDNPIERNLVRQMLPQVAVPELPADPALYSRVLAAGGYFESIAFSSEDAQRASYYQENARRIHLKQQAGDMDSYLASLNMEIFFQPFNIPNRARIVQLINKSNQFNLTTRRYSEAEVADIERDERCFTLQVRLTDAFGDNGMVSVVICRSVSTVEWEIDTWLMSCRVLGRRVENAVLAQLVRSATDRGILKLTGVFRPTGRNKLVEEHYSKLGFQRVDLQSDGTTIWELDVPRAVVEEVPMQVHSSGVEVTEACAR